MRCDSVVPSMSYSMLSCATTLAVAVAAVLTIVVGWLSTVFTFHGI